MKATGAIRRVDDLGRVAIPKEMRKYLNIKEGDALEVFKHDKYIIFTKYKNEDDYFCSYGERKEECQKY